MSVTEEAGEAAPVTGSVNSYSPEFGISRGDATLLARISEETGGRVISDRGSVTGDTVDASHEVDLFERRALRHRPREIWEALMLAAMLLLPVDVGVRRLHFTREQLSEARISLTSKLRRRGPEVLDAGAAAALAQLKDARTRVKLSNEEAANDLRASPAEPLERVSGETSSSTMKSSISGDDEEVESEGEDQPLASRLLAARKRKRE